MGASCRFCWIVTIAAACSGRATAGAPLSADELNKRGMAAAAVVPTKVALPRSFTSAFCIHSSGLYLTCDHFIRLRNPDDPITLVRNPGQKDQVVLPARIVRRDPDLNLALLAVEGQKDIPALPLAAADALAELIEVHTFGPVHQQQQFKPLDLDKIDIPRIVGANGFVSALERKNGSLERLQIDGTFAGSQLGGPLLDRSGRVVGVLSTIRVIGPEKTTHYYAIPVGHLERFLALPEPVVAPKLTMANMHKPALFQVKSTLLTDRAKPPELELILFPGRDNERKAPMKLVDGVYRASAVPVPPPNSALSLRATIYFAGSQVKGLAGDASFKIGAKELKLSEVHRLQRAPKSEAVLRDGTVVAGAITGLKSISLQVGARLVDFDVTQAREIRAERESVVASVPYAVVALTGGKELSRHNGNVPIDGVIAASAPPIRPPVLDKDPVIVPLGGTAVSVAVGGGGRFLILHLRKLGKLAIVDVNQAKVVAHIDGVDERGLYAAGLNKLIIAHPLRQIERWSLLTLERERVVPVPKEVFVARVQMGSASQGPLLVALSARTANGIYNQELTFFDLDTMAPFKPKLAPRVGTSIGLSDQIRVSPDGRVLGMWDSGGARVLVLADRELRATSEPGLPRSLVPGLDGSVIYTANGLYTAQAKPVATHRNGGNICVPAHGGGGFYLCLKRKAARGVDVHTFGEAEPIYSFDISASLLKRKVWEPHQHQTFDAYLHLIPQAQVLAVVPPQADQVLFYRFDLDKALEKSGIPFFITSQPPLNAAKGSTYTYQITTKSKNGGMKYRLDSAPKGMAITEKGLVRWEVPADFREPESWVLLVVQDALGLERYHAFQLAIQ
jgi:S1-C subfamily serine protease